jgi:hypothetical protein
LGLATTRPVLEPSLLRRILLAILAGLLTAKLLTRGNLTRLRLERLEAHRGLAILLSIRALPIQGSIRLAELGLLPVLLLAIRHLSIRLPILLTIRCLAVLRCAVLSRRILGLCAGGLPRLPAIEAAEQVPLLEGAHRGPPPTGPDHQRVIRRQEIPAPLRETIACVCSRATSALRLGCEARLSLHLPARGLVVPRVLLVGRTRVLLVRVTFVGIRVAVRLVLIIRLATALRPCLCGRYDHHRYRG